LSEYFENEFDLLGRTFLMGNKAWCWKPQFPIKEQNKEVGCIRFRWFWNKRVIGKLPDSFSNLVRIFLLWIVLDQWEIGRICF